MEKFNTANRGLAAVFLMNEFEIVDTQLNDKGKPSLNFEKTDRLREIFKLWQDRKLVGNLTDFNDALFKVHTAMKEVQV